MLSLNAYAKVNIGLDVLRKRPDGYHEVRMIMQTIGINDTLTYEKKEQGIIVTTDREELPTDEHNLIYKAAKLMIETYHIQEGVTIHLNKRIPIAAGLAGGSTDAAATMRGMNLLFALGAKDEELMELGVKIGADVPYCIIGGTMLASGIGEVLQTLPRIPQAYLLAVKPDINVSTAFVYGNLHWTDETLHANIDAQINAIRKQDIRGIAGEMRNVLETVTAPAYPVIREIEEKMLACGAYNAMMSGSGPTVFGLFETKEQQEKAYQELKSKFHETYKTDFVNREGEVYGRT